MLTPKGGFVSKAALLPSRSITTSTFLPATSFTSARGERELHKVRKVSWATGKQLPKPLRFAAHLEEDV